MCRVVGIIESRRVDAAVYVPSQRVELVRVVRVDGGDEDGGNGGQPLEPGKILIVRVAKVPSHRPEPGSQPDPILGKVCK